MAQLESMLSFSSVSYAWRYWKPLDAIVMLHKKITLGEEVNSSIIIL